MSKNNPENRGDITELRTYKGKKVKPVLYINGKNRFIAAVYESGELVIDAITKMAVPYKNV